MSAPTMKEKIAALAAERGVRDPVHINVWTEDENGEPNCAPGRQVEIRYRRADGGKRLKAQTGPAWPSPKREAEA
jgi:hypothetical protein